MEFAAGERNARSFHRDGWCVSLRFTHPTLALSTPHLLEIANALFVRRDHVQQSIAIDIGHLELRTDATVVIDLMRRPSRLASDALQLEPEQHRRIARVDVPLGTVSPPPLAGDKIGETIAVDIGQAKRVRLRETIVD